MKYLTIILILIGIFTDIGNCYTVRQNGTRAKIAGGCYIDIKDAPYHVAVLYNGKYYCGGTLLSLKHVLTAAHCIHKKINDPEKPLQIQAGMHDRNDKNVIVDVVDYIVHLKYLKSRDADLAILKLAHPLPSSNRIGVISLPSAPALYGEKVSLTGFGWLRPDIPVSSNRLKRLETSIVDCVATMPKSASYFQRGHICTSNVANSGACKGDSGSPLVNKKRELVGVQIRVYNDPQRKPGLHGYPDLFADVFYFKKFIKRVMKYLK